MAIDPRLSLAVQPFDAARSFSNLLTNIGNYRALEREKELAPLKQQLMQSQVSQGQQAAQANRIQSVALGAAEILPDLQSDNPEAAMQKLMLRRDRLISQGVPTMDTDAAIAMLQTPEGQLQLTQDAENAVKLGQQLGFFGASAAGMEAVQSSQILGDGTTIQLLRSGETRVTDPSGRSLEGQDRAAAIRKAKEFEIEQQKLRSGAREEARLDEQLKTKPLIGSTEAAQKSAIKRSEEVSKQIPAIQESIALYDEAIGLIDQGAQTGVIAQKLPSVRASAQKLDNVQKRLGLNVIQNTTFGALSESELAFALDSALPKGLEGPQLKRWLQSKKEAQQKLLDYTNEAAIFLGTPGNTIAQWLEIQKVNQIEREKTQNQQPSNQEIKTYQSSMLGRSVTEQEIQETMAANPGVTREQILTQLGISDG